MSENAGAKTNVTGEDSARIAVIILTLNQRETTARCLSTFRDVTGPPFRVLLWDNGSDDGTADHVREAFPEVVVHRHPANLGVASGRNAAARLAIETFRPEYLLFMDNDMEVTLGFLAPLLEPLRRDPRIAQTQPKIRFMHDRQRLNDGGGNRVRFWLGSTTPVGYKEIDRGQYDTPKKCIACGGAMLVRAELFRQMGGFDPLFDPFGPEDLDFSLRLYKAGYYALYVPQSVVYHEVSHTFEAGNFSQKYARHKARHWLIFMRRHASPLQLAGFLLIGAPLIALRVLLREGRKGNLGALQGLAHGLLEAIRSSTRARG